MAKGTVEDEVPEGDEVRRGDEVDLQAEEVVVPRVEGVDQPMLRIIWGRGRRARRPSHLASAP
jgi:hypothetical protein